MTTKNGPSKPQVTRREFLKLAGSASLGGLFAFGRPNTERVLAQNEFRVVSCRLAPGAKELIRYLVTDIIGNPQEYTLKWDVENDPSSPRYGLPVATHAKMDRDLSQVIPTQMGNVTVSPDGTIEAIGNRYHPITWILKLNSFFPVDLTNLFQVEGVEPIYLPGTSNIIVEGSGGYLCLIDSTTTPLTIKELGSTAGLSDPLSPDIPGKYQGVANGFRSEFSFEPYIHTFEDLMATKHLYGLSRENSQMVRKPDGTHQAHIVGWANAFGRNVLFNPRESVGTIVAEQGDTNFRLGAYASNGHFILISERQTLDTTTGQTIPNPWYTNGWTNVVNFGIYTSLAVGTSIQGTALMANVDVLVANVGGNYSNPGIYYSVNPFSPSGDKSWQKVSNPTAHRLFGPLLHQYQRQLN